jgi:type VI secretion system protein ImpC
MLASGVKAETSPLPPGQRGWQEFLQALVAPHVEPGVDPRQEELAAVVEEATAVQMRLLLHHPAFQTLEAAWRGLHLLVRQLDTDSGLQLHLLDVTREELAADCAAATEQEGNSELYRILVERTVGTPGAERWAVLAGNFTFEPAAADLELLHYLGTLAGAAGTSFLAAADSRLFGCDDLARHPDPSTWPENATELASWDELRRLPEARSIGLIAPRLLLRLPYGRGGTATDTFEFEEMPGRPSHSAYLWGNPAFAGLYLLGASFNRSGWEMRPGELLLVEDLPAHVYDEDGERVLKPCAEVLLTDRAIEAMLQRGVMPLLSQVGRAAVRLGRFQSIAEPATPLSGPWQS